MKMAWRPCRCFMGMIMNRSPHRRLRAHHLRVRHDAALRRTRHQSIGLDRRSALFPQGDSWMVVRCASPRIDGTDSRLRLSRDRHRPRARARPITCGHARSAAHAATPRRILPVEIPRIRSGILGGLGGAFAMAAVALAWGALTNHTIWMPINLLAAMVLETFNTDDLQSLVGVQRLGLAAAAAIHISMSIMVGLVLASLIPMAIGWPRIFSIVVAPFTWSLLTYGAMGVLDPTLEKWVDWYWFVGSQIAFGSVCGFPHRTFRATSRRFSSSPRRNAWDLRRLMIITTRPGEPSS